MGLREARPRPRRRPELVIQRIADYRADDKDDPDYYARRTVTKAQAELRAMTSPQTPGPVPVEINEQRGR